MIKAIISDLGNVIVFFTHHNLANGLAKYSNLVPKEINKVLIDSDLDVDFHEGKITPKEFYDGVTQMLGLSLKFDVFKEIYNGIDTGTNNDFLDALNELKDRYSIVALSDTNELHAEYMKNKFSFWDLFDHKILSNEVHASKARSPGKIFGIAVGTAGCLPEECVYIDDVESYVEAAISIGMHGIHYKNNEELFQELEKLGIKIN